MKRARVPDRVRGRAVSTCVTLPICVTVLICMTVLAATTVHALAQGALPSGFVYLRDVDPTIVQDIRYAGSDNFVGRPLPGYEAAECILRQEVAGALKRVQADLAAAGSSLLKVYDCYRPVRAARAMVAWAHDGRPDGATKRFYPKLQKSALFGLGYIASRSQHSTGAAVDLTLVTASSAQVPVYDPTATYGLCTQAAAQRSPDNSVDMGTGYDCFDLRSHTASAGIGSEQRRWRNTLVEAMRKQGFANYGREWWHFSYAQSGRASQHDFPIRSAAAARSSGGDSMTRGR
jgi:zinc D-Ala-D-Ala dipeptidase